MAAPDLKLVRYTADGALDTTFGSGGVVTENVGSTAVSCDAAMQAGGMVVAAVIMRRHGHLLRFTTGGDLDETNFAPTAWSRPALPPPGAAVQPDGRILVAGDAGGSNFTCCATQPTARRWIQPSTMTDRRWLV